MERSESMACEHKRLKSVNCVIMCADCGAVMEIGTSSGADAPPSPTRSKSFRAQGEGVEKAKKPATRGRSAKKKGESGE